MAEPWQVVSSILGFGAFALAALVTIMNWGGFIEAWRRRRRGIVGGYSSVPLISLLCCVGAWFAIEDKIGLWSFAPAAIDFGTLNLIALPFFLLKEAIRKK